MVQSRSDGDGQRGPPEHLLRRYAHLTTAAGKREWLSYSWRGMIDVTLVTIELAGNFSSDTGRDLVALISGDISAASDSWSTDVRVNEPDKLCECVCTVCCEVAFSRELWPSGELFLVWRPVSDQHHCTCAVAAKPVGCICRCTDHVPSTAPRSVLCSVTTLQRLSASYMDVRVASHRIALPPRVVLFCRALNSAYVLFLRLLFIGSIESVVLLLSISCLHYS